ncbi:hypothetical protein AAF712_008270 [Marasmius tenuissimus]|uniref:Uncharacterized protein n=1 Tax=Marasmius tenuissimus TaxID=585030 RepID=A0ABR2ZUI9_9AGAR|nr:hypothetical protein PM082_004943 [Marasmius tenuissimus]
MSNLARKSFMKNWMAVEALPILGIVTFVVTGGSYALYRSALGPTIQWTRSNATPWNEIKPTQGTKMLDPTGHFNERWSRERL